LDKLQIWAGDLYQMVVRCCEGVVELFSHTLGSWRSPVSVIHRTVGLGVQLVRSGRGVGAGLQSSMSARSKMVLAYLC
jgi:hypothetical protein